MKGQTGIHNIYKVAYQADPGERCRICIAHGNGERRMATVTPSGPREATLNIAVAPLISKEMQEIGRLIIFDDITDRSELERRLVQADKLSSIGLLAAGVAHEVNTPLAVISTYAQMLAKQVSGDEQKSKLLDKIAKSDVPRQRDRQLAPELLPHIARRVRRGRRQPGPGRDDLAGSAPTGQSCVSRTSIELAAGAAGGHGQRRQTAAGVPEPRPERARRDGRRRHSDRPNLERRRLRAHRHPRHRAGNCARHICRASTIRSSRPRRRAKALAWVYR